MSLMFFDLCATAGWGRFLRPLASLHLFCRGVDVLPVVLTVSPTPHVTGHTSPSGGQEWQPRQAEPRDGPRCGLAEVKGAPDQQDGTERTVTEGSVAEQWVLT